MTVFRILSPLVVSLLGQWQELSLCSKQVPALNSTAVLAMGVVEPQLISESRCLLWPLRGL